MSDEPKVHAIITRVMVSGLPLDRADASCWALHVEWRGGDLYAVTRGGQPSAAYASDGTWEYDNADHGEKWTAAHRFSYNDAMALAVRLVPDLRINGMVAADVLERFPSPPATQESESR